MWSEITSQYFLIWMYPHHWVGVYYNEATFRWHRWVSLVTTIWFDAIIPCQSWRLAMIIRKHIICDCCSTILKCAYWKMTDIGNYISIIQQNLVEVVTPSIMSIDPSSYGRSSTSAKTKFPSLNWFSILYTQTQNNEIEVSQIDNCALMLRSVIWVIGMQDSSATVSVPTSANLTTSTSRTVHTFFGNITNHLSAYSNVTQLDLDSRW